LLSHPDIFTQIPLANSAKQTSLEGAVPTPSLQIASSRTIIPRDKANLAWHGWHAFRGGLATNLHRLGVSDKVIQQILRHANVTTTMNIHVKTVSADEAKEMKSL
jgi:integrase